MNMEDDFDKDNEVMEEKQVEQEVPSDYTLTEDVQEYHEGTFGNFIESPIADQTVTTLVDPENIDTDMFLELGDSKMSEETK